MGRRASRRLRGVTPRLNVLALAVVATAGSADGQPACTDLERGFHCIHDNGSGHFLLTSADHDVLFRGNPADRNTCLEAVAALKSRLSRRITMDCGTHPQQFGQVRSNAGTNLDLCRSDAALINADIGNGFNIGCENHGNQVFFRLQNCRAVIGILNTFAGMPCTGQGAPTQAVPPSSAPSTVAPVTASPTTSQPTPLPTRPVVNQPNDCGDVHIDCSAGEDHVANQGQIRCYQSVQGSVCMCLGNFRCDSGNQGPCRPGDTCMALPTAVPTSTVPTGSPSWSPESSHPTQSPTQFPTAPPTYLPSLATTQQLQSTNQVPATSLSSTFRRDLASSSSQTATSPTLTSPSAKVRDGQSTAIENSSSGDSQDSAIVAVSVAAVLIIALTIAVAWLYIRRSSDQGSRNNTSGFDNPLYDASSSEPQTTQNKQVEPYMDVMPTTFMEVPESNGYMDVPSPPAGSNPIDDEEDV